MSSTLRSTTNSRPDSFGPTPKSRVYSADDHGIEIEEDRLSTVCRLASDSKSIVIFISGTTVSLLNQPAKAGSGVYFAEGSPFNAAERVPAEYTQTLAIAEVYATQVALENLLKRSTENDKEYEHGDVNSVTNSDEGSYGDDYFFRRFESGTPPNTAPTGANMQVPNLTTGVGEGGSSGGSTLMSDTSTLAGGMATGVSTARSGNTSTRDAGTGSSVTPPPSTVGEDTVVENATSGGTGTGALSAGTLVEDTLAGGLSGDDALTGGTMNSLAESTTREDRLARRQRETLADNEVNAFGSLAAGGQQPGFRMTFPIRPARIASNTPVAAAREVPLATTNGPLATRNNGTSGVIGLDNASPQPQNNVRNSVQHEHSPVAHPDITRVVIVTECEEVINTMCDDDWKWLMQNGELGEEAARERNKQTKLRDYLSPAVTQRVSIFGGTHFQPVDFVEPSGLVENEKLKMEVTERLAEVEFMKIEVNFWLVEEGSIEEALALAKEGLVKVPTAMYWLKN